MKDKFYANINQEAMVKHNFAQKIMQKDIEHVLEMSEMFNF